MLTKSAEIATLRQFVASLPPESYLADYFVGAVDYFADAVTQDILFAHADRLRGGQNDLRQLEIDAVAARKQLAEIKSARLAAERRLAEIQRSIEQAKIAAAKIRDSLWVCEHVNCTHSISRLRPIACV